MATITDFQKLYASGKNAEQVLREIWEKIRDEPDDGIFISKTSWEGVLTQLENADPKSPLFGVPFAVKDNIDFAGLPTTAACPEFAYQPSESATVVKLLLEAGAICIGKTNLDQFATGLVGVRTPYPIPKNPFDEKYLPGGSSSGSAVAVSKGLVAFSLGTDTAGSGRVPAAFNELIGLKPTCGFLSTKGVVDACKSIDCVSVFTNNCTDADTIFSLTAKSDPDEAWSKKPPVKWKRIPAEFKFGVPKSDELQFFGWESARNLYEQAAQRLEAIGGQRIEISLEPFTMAAKLLYEGPWVTERFVAIKDFLKSNPDSVFPVTRKIIEGGESLLASDCFSSQYKLADCKRLADQQMQKVDFILVPTTPRNFTLDEVAAEPVKLNSILGTYTNFMNLLDYSALALPAGRFENQLPWGVTLFAAAGMDRALLEIGSIYMNESTRKQTPDSNFDEIHVVVCGAHLSGMPLNWQLTDRGGRLVSKNQTSPCYRMFLIPAGNGLPERPALIQTEDGVAISTEVWALTTEAFGDFVSKIPAPLGIGKISLDDGRELCGFIAEPKAAINARDLSEFGGWRRYIDSKT